jgi:hypothetical protein
MNYTTLDTLLRLLNTIEELLTYKARKSWEKLKAFRGIYLKKKK